MTHLKNLWDIRHSGKRITKRLCFGGGFPKYHRIPKFIKWGSNVSMFWLDFELVRLGRKEEKNNG